MNATVRFRVETARALADKAWCLTEELARHRDEAKAAYAAFDKLTADEVKALGLSAKAQALLDDVRELEDAIALLQQAGTGPNLAAGCAEAKTAAHRSKKDREAMAKKAGAEAPKPKAPKAKAEGAAK